MHLHLLLKHQFNISRSQILGNTMKCSFRTGIKWLLRNSHLSLRREVPVAALLHKSHSPSSLFLEVWLLFLWDMRWVSVPSVSPPFCPFLIPLLSPHFTHGMQGKGKRVTHLYRLTSSMSIGIDRSCIQIKIHMKVNFSLQTGSCEVNGERKQYFCWKDFYSFDFLGFI